MIYYCGEGVVFSTGVQMGKLRDSVLITYYVTEIKLFLTNHMAVY